MVALGSLLSLFIEIKISMLKQMDGRSFWNIRTGGKSELHRTGCWVIPSPGNGQESATENRPPKETKFSLSQWVRVKRRGKSSPVLMVTSRAW